jgi:signal transduction histidine kinase
MKTKFVTRNVYATTIILFVFVLLVIFKLNDYYKTEKSQIVKTQMSQQNSNLKSSVSTQMSQLKNILSGYMYQIDEAKINWVQLESMTVLAQTHISKNGEISVKSIFTKSGSKSERWTKEFLQKALNLKKYSKKPIHVELFQTKSGDKYLAMTYLQDGATLTSSAEAVTVVADASYFQKMFDLNRSRKVTHVLMTDLNTVAGHSESDYVATVTAENNINPERYFINSEELRSTNLKIISYTAKSAVISIINIPFMLLGLILGFACLLVGILFYAFRPIEKTLQQQKATQREELYRKSLSENIESSQLLSANDIAAPEPVAVVRKAQASVAAPLPKPIDPPVIQTLVQSSQEMSLPTNFSFDPIVAEHHARVSLNSLLSDVLSDLEQLMTSQGIRLQQDFKATLEFEVDVMRFKKLLGNVLKNAIEAVKEVVVKKIEIRTFDRDGKSFVEIQDSGMGLKHDNLERVWQPYYTTKEKSKHQGLGLSESLSIAQRYGGNITLVNVPSGGALVQIVMTGPEVENIAGENMATETHQDLDLDQILDLDHDTESDLEKTKPMIDLEKEFTTTQFKLDPRLDIVEDPQIQVSRNDKAIDQFKVRIRGPQKS